VRAYGEAVGLALDAAGTRERRQLHTMRVTAPTAEAGALEHRLRSLGIVSHTIYDRHVTWTVGVAEPEQFATAVAASSAGRATVERVGTSWVDV
jgi:putative IMPACT (imprinted ancient) family translation regulator